MITLILGRGRLRTVDYEEITINDAVKTLTAAKVKTAFMARVYFENGPVRYTLHGVDPTTTFGLAGLDNAFVDLVGTEMNNFRSIRETATDGIARVLYLQNDSEPMG